MIMFRLNMNYKMHLISCSKIYPCICIELQTSKYNGKWCKHNKKFST